MLNLRSLTLFSLTIFIFSPFVAFSQTNNELDYRKFRVTLVPGLSTNGLDAHHYNAKYSLNLLVGYHGGLEGYELGLVNINRKFARGVQLGILNLSGGEMAGVQIASLANISRYEQQGLQISGLVNTSGDHMQGIQLSGLANVSRGSILGLQLSGGLNIGEEMQGIQFSTIGNFSSGSSQGMQISGITNFSGGDLQGIILSGVTNISRGPAQGILVSGGANISGELQGISTAGVLNISSQMQGIQISGLANIAETGQGIQIGLINFAKEFEGIPVGLFSYYGDGRKNIDTWFSDGGFTHIGLNLGSHEIYNKISFGYNPLITDRDVWALGWSIGSYRTLDVAWNKPVLQDYFSTHDFTIQNIFDGNWNRTPNFIYSYRYLLGKNLMNDLALYAGPSANLQVSKQEGSSDYTWYSLINSTRADRDIRFWIGFTVGLRLLGQ